MKPVDLYLRVSRVGDRDAEADSFRSVSDQEADARRFAEGKGLTVGEVITDKDQSGGTTDRPGLRKALDRVEQGKSGGIVVAYLSRLSRETTQGLSLLEQVRHAGGTVYAPNLPENHRSADGKMLTTIQLAIDTGYRERKAEEFERAKIGATERGIPITPRLAPGILRTYDPEKPGRVVGLQVDPEVAPTIRRVFEERRDGAGPTALASILEQAGVKTSHGGETWSKTAVYALLKNPIYKGELRYGTHVNEAAVEPIVDERLWDSVQSTRRRTTRTGATAPTWLTPKARCGSCSSGLRGTVSSRGKLVYRCDRRGCPAPVRVYAAELEAHVGEYLLVWHAGAPAIRPDREDGTDTARAEVEAAKARLKRVLLQDGKIDSDVFDEARDEAQRDLTAARDRLARLEEIADPPADDGGVFAHGWPAMTADQRREVVAQTLDAVIVWKGERGEPLASRSVIYYRGDAPAGVPVARPAKGLKPTPIPRPADDLQGLIMASVPSWAARECGSPEEALNVALLARIGHEGFTDEEASFIEQAKSGALDRDALDAYYAREYGMTFRVEPS